MYDIVLTIAVIIIEYYNIHFITMHCVTRRYQNGKAKSIVIGVKRTDLRHSRDGLCSSYYRWPAQRISRVHLGT